MSWMYAADSMERLHRQRWRGVLAGTAVGVVLGALVGLVAGGPDAAFAAAVVGGAVGGLPGLLAREGCLLLRMTRAERASGHRLEAHAHLAMPAGTATGAAGGVGAAFALPWQEPSAFLALPALTCVGALVGGLLGLVVLAGVGRSTSAVRSWSWEVVVTWGAGTVAALLGAAVGWGVSAGAAPATVWCGAVGACAGMWGGHRLHRSAY